MANRYYTDTRWRALTAPMLLLLLGAALRVAPLTDFRFHADEALYASYGRLISTYDPLLASRLVDKPPLSFYLIAVSFMRIGPHEIAARLPGLFASVISLALVWRLALALWGDRRAALLALAFAGLSPLAILFGSTAFTDPLLTAFLLASLVAAVQSRPGWAGVWFALALMTKQSALFFAPLVVVFVVQQGGYAKLFPRAIRFVVPILVATSLLAIWNVARPDVPGFWVAGLDANAPAGFAPLREIGPRLRDWLSWLSYLGGWWPANVMLLAGCMAALFMALRQRLFPDLLVILFVVGYLMAHWLLSFHIYDRYLLPLVPLLALLAARGWLWLTRQRVVWALVGLLAVMAWPAFKAAQGAYPVGGDKGAYDGIEQVAAYLDALPDGTVIYDHWLGWPLDFYLFDSPHYTTFFAMPATLTDMLRQQDIPSGAVLVLPVWIAPDEQVAVVAAVESAGYGMLLDFEVSGRQGAPTLAVYRLAPQ